MPSTKKTPTEAHDAEAEAETPQDAPAPTPADDGPDSSESGKAKKQPDPAPRFCAVCGDPLTRVEQPQSGGFDPMTGEKKPDGIRVTVECARIYHPRFYLSDGEWLPVT